MNRRTHDLIYHRTFVEQHHLRPDDAATRTPPVFSREAMGFKMPERRVVKSTCFPTRALR